MIPGLLLTVVGVYVLAGAGFAAWFFARGLRTVDRSGAEASAWFRAMIAPGVIALWPVLLGRARRAGKHPHGMAEKGVR